MNSSEKPEGLARYRVEIGEQHLRALLETCLGAGMERFANHGGDLIVVWNNQASDKVTRTLNAYVPGRWMHWFNLTVEHGKAENNRGVSTGEGFRQRTALGLAAGLGGDPYGDSGRRKESLILINRASYKKAPCFIARCFLLRARIV